MFMKQLYVIVISLFALVVNVFAANNDKLYTSDNKVYTGIISTQIPGKQIIFISDGQVIPFDYSELLMIRYEEHDPKLLTGLNDVIKTRDGKVFRGQITEQEFGKSIKIKTSEAEETIDASNILEQQKEKMSPDYTLMEQAPYKTLIKTCNEEEEYTGVVVFQYYGNEETPSYLEISSEDGVIKRVYISDISQMRRIPNTEYREIEAKSFNIEDGKVYFNQLEISPVFLSKQKKGKRFIFFVNENVIANHAIVDCGKGELSVEMKEETEYSYYKLMRIESKKIGKKNLYAFDDDLIERNLMNPSSSKVGSNDVMSKVYNVEAGMYLFFKQGSDKVFFVEIEKQ